MFGQSSWIDKVRGIKLPDVASELGMVVKGRRALSPCPACQAEIRGYSSRDRRGPVGLTANANGWRCHRCSAGGDALDLVAYQIGGHCMADLDAHGKAQVRAFYAARQWCAPLGGSPKGGPNNRTQISACKRIKIEPTLPRRPPPDEVAALWRAAAPLDQTQANPDRRPMHTILGHLAQVNDMDPSELPPELFQAHETGFSSVPDPAEYWPTFYLSERRFHVPSLARLDVVRALPLRYAWPSWWSARWARHYRLAVRAFEPNGTLASLHARVIPAYDPDGQRLAEPKPKTRWPIGYAAEGLLLADPNGLDLLRGRVGPGIRKVWIGEGLTDFRAFHGVFATGLAG